MPGDLRQRGQEFYCVVCGGCGRSLRSLTNPAGKPGPEPVRVCVGAASDFVPWLITAYYVDVGWPLCRAVCLGVSGCMPASVRPAKIILKDLLETRNFLPPPHTIYHSIIFRNDAI